VTSPARWRRIEELCHAALECDACERPVFLTTACGGDEALRRDVEALLQHAPAADAFLASPMGELAASVLTDDDSGSLVGRQVGSYQVVSRLGAGGMGEVYRARDPKLGATWRSKCCRGCLWPIGSGWRDSIRRRGCWPR
jgi:hypothetical protein